MKAIVAHCNGIIGQGTEIPWHFSSDFKFFKEMTIGSTIIMGSTTFFSLKAPLQNRHHVVISNKQYSIPNAEVYSVNDLPVNKFKDAFVIGGAKTYDLLKPYIDEFYVTEISQYGTNTNFVEECTKDIVKLTPSLFNTYKEIENVSIIDINKKDEQKYILTFRYLKQKG